MASENGFIPLMGAVRIVLLKWLIAEHNKGQTDVRPCSIIMLQSLRIVREAECSVSLY